jgi:hypothetical protein
LAQGRQLFCNCHWQVCSHLLWEILLDVSHLLWRKIMSQQNFEMYIKFSLSYLWNPLSFRLWKRSKANLLQ